MPDSANAKAALVIAHPGHELCVHGWLSAAKPVVFVLTDGSGRQGVSRLSSTTRNLLAAGAQPGEFYGRVSDALIYQSLLHHDTPFFTGLATELADHLILGNFDYVVGDAVEGYNPTHDVCRLLVNAAVEIANHSLGMRRIKNYDFAIVRPPENGAESAGCIRFPLDEVSYNRKVETMRNCPELADEVSAGLDGARLKKLEMLGDLADEVRKLIKVRGGAASFRVECLREIVEGTAKNAEVDEPSPFYERYAEKLVAAGLYQQVIRYREHVAPIAEALRELATAPSIIAVPNIRRLEATSQL